MSLAWVDGRMLDAARAIPAEDAAFRAGHALFETVGAAGGRLPLWPHHLERLARGAARLQITCEAPAGMRASAEELLALTAQGDGVLRLVLSAGGPGDAPRWVMTTRARPAVEVVRLIVAEHPLPDDWPFATIKTSARPHYAAAFAAARAAGAGDALMLERSGLVAETTTCNVIAEQGGGLVTPRATGRFLPGIARRLLLQNTAVREAELDLDALRRSGGVWVCNAVHGVRPASLPDGPPPADPGPLAKVWWRILAAG